MRLIDRQGKCVRAACVCIYKTPWSIDGQRASPARPSTTSGRHGPVLDGPPRADGPTVPCRYGLRAWPSA